MVIYQNMECISMSSTLETTNFQQSLNDCSLAEFLKIEVFLISAPWYVYILVLLTM